MFLFSKKQNTHSHAVKKRQNNRNDKLYTIILGAIPKTKTILLSKLFTNLIQNKDFIELAKQINQDELCKIFKSSLENKQNQIMIIQPEKKNHNKPTEKKKKSKDKNF